MQNATHIRHRALKPVRAACREPPPCIEACDNVQDSWTSATFDHEERKENAVPDGVDSVAA
jgi:hypothetical protein